MGMIITAAALWAFVYLLSRELPGSRLYHLSPLGAVVVFVVGGSGGLLLQHCEDQRRVARFAGRLDELQRHAEEALSAGAVEGLEGEDLEQFSPKEIVIIERPAGSSRRLEGERE